MDVGSDAGYLYPDAVKEDEAVGGHIHESVGGVADEANRGRELAGVRQESEKRWRTLAECETGISTDRESKAHSSNHPITRIRPQDADRGRRFMLHRFLLRNPAFRAATVKERYDTTTIKTETSSRAGRLFDANIRQFDIRDAPPEFQSAFDSIACRAKDQLVTCLHTKSVIEL